MFTPGQYRAKAAEYGKLLETAGGPKEHREFQALEQSFTVLADDQQWLIDNYGTALRSTELRQADGPTLTQEENEILPQEENEILRYLGAAPILKWNSLPQKLRRELFDIAGGMGDVSEPAVLRGKIARFLHMHKNDNGAVT